MKEAVDYQEIFQKNKGNNLKTLLAMYTGKYVQLFWSIVFFLIKHSPTWISPIILATIIDIITNPDDKAVPKILINSLFMAVMILQNIPTNYVHTYFYAKAIRQVEKELRRALVRKLQQLSISYHTNTESGRLQSKVMRDVEQIENLSAQIFISILSILVSIIASLVIVVFKNRIVFLFFIGTVPIAVLIMVYFKGKIKNYNREFRKEMEQTSVSVMEMVEMIPITRAHGLEEKEADKMENQLENVAQKGFKLDMIQTYFGSISWVAFQIFQVFCLIFTSLMALKGKISIGDVALYQSYFSSVVGNVANIVGLIPIVAKGLESVESVGDILLSKDVENNKGRRHVADVDGEVVFENVSYSYADSEENVLRDVSFKAKKGETIAIVGASGAGKSTILNLIIGFMQADKGNVLIDGNNINDIDLHAYREHIAVVPQNSILFGGTIRDNITYGLSDVDDKELWSLIEASNLDELIKSLPDGLDTVIKEHGANLSGGQRQRISIARAFIRQPKILILDEATSALDTISEKKIQEATSRLTKDRTTFIVAHRLSTIRDADKIVVMEKGCLKEFGTYDELMEKKGAFYRLKALQA